MGEGLDWLYKMDIHGMNLGLERVKDILCKLGNPEKKLKCIHIAGTNGKGSVCAMIDSILRMQGYKTGLYTSPHLKRFNERIKVNGIDIPDERLEELVKRVRQFYTCQTFFEITTAIAFLYFAEEKADFVVLEVGLGGRLDATNVVVPLVSVITNISIEHADILGDILEKIAYEKAGIIKENIPIITLAKNSALNVIKGIAKKKNAEVIIPNFSVKNGKLSIGKHKNLELCLKGDFQFPNAAIAVAVIDTLNKIGFPVSEAAIRNGLKNAKWHGRLEFIDKNVLVDCAHNPAGISVLADEVKKIRKNYNKIISVIAILKDKDREKMLEIISSFSDYIIFCMPKIARASEPEELAKMVKIPNETVHDAKNALKKARKIANDGDLVVVAGSIYVIGEVI
jgi:dihydrofolate synthase/folylpolyglutamate synthase